MLLLAVMLGAVAFAGIPLIRSWWKPQPAKVVVEDKKSRYGEKEAGVLKELITVYRRMDSLPVLEMGGRIVATDPANPSDDLHADFNFQRKDSMLYYQLGESEMVQLQEVNISINKSVNRMFVTPPQTIVMMPHLPIDTIIALWEDERYAISTQEIDQQVTVSFVCERHVSCKELKITYNRTSGKMNNVYMRLTNLSDPFNKASDKVIDITLNRWEEGKVNDNYFTISRYLKKDAGSWQPAGAYSQYKLISTL